MRRLHPPTPFERPYAHGIVHGPVGEPEVWTIHALPEGRHVVRVEVAERDLWHLSLDEWNRPERLQARVHRGERTFDTVYTFFDDEVLIWRRGGGGGSDAIALPAGYRVMWPPFAGRGFLVGAQALGAGTSPYLWMERTSTDAGAEESGAIAAWVEDVDCAGDVPEMRLTGQRCGSQVAEVDPDGILRRWTGPAGVAEELCVVREAAASAVPADQAKGAERG